MDELELKAHAAALGATHPVIRADMQIVAWQWEKERAALWAASGWGYVCGYNTKYLSPI